MKSHINYKLLAEGLEELYHDYTFYVVKNKPNYDDYDFTFDNFMRWVKNVASK
jgi:hypothetical protein